jgi:excisionase family DNA binding protein
MTEEAFLSTAAVAARLGLSPESVLRRFRRGELTGYRLASNVLRFRAADLDAYLEARRETNAAHPSGEEVSA